MYLDLTRGHEVVDDVVSRQAIAQRASARVALLLVVIAARLEAILLRLPILVRRKIHAVHMHLVARSEGCEHFAVSSFNAFWDTDPDTISRRS